MRFVYVLEDDPKFQSEIVEAIQGVDPKIQIRLFSHLDAFVAWVKTVMESGPAAIEKGGEIPTGVAMEAIQNETHVLSAVISKVEFLGVKQLALLKKSRDLFIKQKVCSAEEPTAFVLTAFEEPTFKIFDLENRILNNVIMKPFDKLILMQHLNFAIDGRHPPSKYTIANQKTKAVIEMLKDVKMKAFGEIGFLTKSELKLDGRVLLSKYYGKQFSTDSKSSLMAVMYNCKEDPDSPSEYICTFGYFGLSSSQIAAIRKKIRNNTCEYKLQWEDLNRSSNRDGRPFGIVIIDENEQNAAELVDLLTRKFKSPKITCYESYGEMMYDLDPRLADTEAGAEKVMGFPADQEVTFTFDHVGTHIKKITSASTTPIQLFGLDQAVIVEASGWWQQHLGSAQMKRWREWLQVPVATAFKLDIDGKKYFIKPGVIEKDAKTKAIKVTFKELTPEEKYDFLIQQSQLPKSVDLVLVGHKFIQHSEIEKWTHVKEHFANRASGETSELKTQVIILASRNYLDEELRELAKFVADIFYRPLDRGYLCQKIKFLFPELESTKDIIDFPTLESAELIQTAMPVQISEISEAGLVMQYYRSITPGEFRNFVLWKAHENDAPRILATCNFTEPAAASEAGAEVFNNHFVFFGATDHFLKAVRIWIHDNYISSKGV